MEPVARGRPRGAREALGASWATMKDPLQREQSPYEILGIPETASREAVERAFKSALRHGAQRATKARFALVNAVERAVIDAFLYPAESLAVLDPSPLDDETALSIERRDATLASWQRQVHATFPPDVELVRCLA